MILVYSRNRARTDLRIAHVLSVLNRPISMNELTRQIKQYYGSGNYPGINKKLHEMELNGIVHLTRIGRSVTARLNLQNYDTINLLATMEINKERELIKRYSLLSNIIHSIQTACNKFHFIHSLTIVNPKENMKLNRIEFLAIFKPKEVDQNWRKEFEDGLLEEKQKLRKQMITLAEKHVLRIDYLFMDRKDFLFSTQSQDINQVKEMFLNKIVFLNPNAFWVEMKEVLESGYGLNDSQTLGTSETNPIDITENDIIYNLARFGYTEFGSTVERGNNISIEYIITSILMKDDARRIEAVPILIAKNRGGIVIELLGFLCKKYDVFKKLVNTLDTSSKYTSELKDKFELYNVHATLE